MEKICYYCIKKRNNREKEGAVARERIAKLQERLLSERKKQQEKYEDDYLVSATEPFDRLHKQFVALFDVDVIEKTGNGALRGTPAQFRAVLDELLVLAQIWDVNMERAVWGKYPNKCPYPDCLSKPCICEGQKSRPHKRLRIRLPEQGLTLEEARQMLAEIYPAELSRPQKVQVLNVVEEIDEIENEVRNFGRDRDLRDEFADVFARMAALATHLGIHLEGITP